MIVDINEGLRVRFDSTCWSIEKRQYIEKGKDAGGYRWPSIGYYGGLNEALYAVLNKHLNLLTDAEKMPIKEVFELLDTAKHDFIKLAKKETE